MIGPLDQSVRGAITFAAFERVHELGLRFHLSRKTGQLVDVINRGIGAAWQMIFGVLMTLVPVVLDLTVVAVVLVSRFDAIYALIIVATAIAYGVSLVVGAEKLRPYMRKANDEWSEIWGQAVDGLLNYETVKYFNAEIATARRLDESIRKYERTSGISLRVRIVTALIPIAIVCSGFTVIMFLAGHEAATGAITIGGFIVVHAYLYTALLPLERIAQLYRDTKQAVISTEALMKLFAESPDIRDAADAIPLPAGPGAISFRDVSFAYEERRPILQDVSFDVPAGTTVALVGASGAGKTTIGRLLFRFYEPQRGEILVNGVDARRVTVDSLRAAIGVVPQDTVLFNESLASNLAFAVGNATREEIERAARLSHLHEFVSTLPEGYDAVVGQRGLKLSGGEKQRVAIARVVLKRPSIFLFDEATSSLDTQTERVIQENLREISRGATTLIIAHRLSTVVHADQILVFDQGRIVERGDHGSLLQQNGKYAALWARQQNELLATE